jgi:hypothetical protein
MYDQIFAAKLEAEVLNDIDSQHAHKICELFGQPNLAWFQNS